MSTELDFELVEDSIDGGDEVTIETNEDTTASDSTESQSDSEENTISTKSKKSNFKKIAKLNKALKAENKRLREAQSEAQDDDDEDFDDEDTSTADNFDRTEFRFFTLENPEAKEFSDAIEEIVTVNPNMSFDDALTLVKAKQPRTSSSSNDFGTTSANTKVRKRLNDLTSDEALTLSPAKYLEWSRAK